MNARTILFTGGCRSGKSGLAQYWAESMAEERAYVATSRSRDDAELAERVRLHQTARGTGWVTVEPESVSPYGPLDAVAALERGAAQARVLLFDCVTLWLSDHLWHAADQNGPDDMDTTPILQAVDALAAWLARCPLPVALVTNELGLGMVPENALSRRFRDLAGLTNQRLGDVCQGVVLAVCGQPLVVKGEPELHHVLLHRPRRRRLLPGPGHTAAGQED